MRAVFEALERLGIGYFLTGSEAASLYGSIRQSFDTDVVIDLQPSTFDVIGREFAGPFLVNDPIDYGDISMASLIDVQTAAKVDLIMRRPGAWADSVMARRRRDDHPAFGSVWVSTVEDLILAKLMWSEGTSELQLRDCAILVRLNRNEIDWSYTERWAASLGVRDLLQQVRDAT
jgi:hypothetical protein